MTKLSFIFVLLFLIHSGIFAQDAQKHLKDGKAKSQVGSFFEAQKSFDKALQIDPKLEEAYYYRGELFYKIRRYTDAQIDLSKAIELGASHSPTYHLRGLSYIGLENYETAIQDFTKAISIAPNNDIYYADRANAYLLMKKYSKALRDCEKSLALNNYSAKARCITGLIKLELGELQEAERYLKAATYANPNHAEYYYHLAEIYRQKEDIEKSIEAYSSAISLNPHHYKSFLGRAVLRLELKDYEKANQDANQSIWKNRRYFKAYVIRAITRYHLNKPEKSEDDINFYTSRAKKAEDYFFIADNFDKYLIHTQGVHSSYLTRAGNWAKQAVEKENNYQNNYLYANILFQLNKNTTAKNIASKLIHEASKNSINYREAKALLASIEQVNQDEIPPHILITSPNLVAQRGVKVVDEADKIMIMGKVSDENGIEKVLINGNPARVDAYGNFDGEAILDKTENLVIVKAIDTKGNEQKKQFVIKKEAKITKKEPQKEKEEIRQSLGKHQALLFASNEYDHWGNLVNPVEDAKAIAVELEEIYGFEIELIQNPSKEQMILKLKEYARKDYGVGDELFLFFAGHGQFDDIFKEGYVVAKDSRLDDESKSSYISHSNLRTYINNINCKHIFMVMDVCFGGTFDPVVARRGNEEDISASKLAFINRRLRYTTRQYLTSGGKEYVSDGVPGKHSPFARKLLEALRQGDAGNGILSLEELKTFFANIEPKPQFGEFGNNEPGSDFLFVAR